MLLIEKEMLEENVIQRNDELVLYIQKISYSEVFYRNVQVGDTENIQWGFVNVEFRREYKNGKVYLGWFYRGFGLMNGNDCYFYVQISTRLCYELDQVRIKNYF